MGGKLRRRQADLYREIHLGRGNDMPHLQTNSTGYCFVLFSSGKKRTHQNISLVCLLVRSGMFIRLSWKNKSSNFESTRSNSRLIFQERTGHQYNDCRPCFQGVPSPNRMFVEGWRSKKPFSKLTPSFLSHQASCLKALAHINLYNRYSSFQNEQIGLVF